MAWRAPRYGHTHAGRDAGASGITAEDATLMNPEFLVDDRAGALCEIAPDTPAGSGYIWFDLGAGMPMFNRVFIPAGWSGFDSITVRENTTAATLGSSTLTADTPVTAGNPISLNFSQDSSLQFIGLQMDAMQDPSYLGELIFTTMLTTVERGPAQVPGWTDQFVTNRLDFTKESGAVYSLALGPDARQFSYQYRNVRDADDQRLFANLFAAVGTYAPFVLDPDYTVDYDGNPEIGVWVKFSSDPRRLEDAPMPAAVSWFQFQYTMEMLEHLA